MEEDEIEARKAKGRQAFKSTILGLFIILGLLVLAWYWLGHAGDSALEKLGIENVD
ncbi:MAG: hypothetical protein V3R73_05625 [Sphingomonadales bacterium]